MQGFVEVLFCLFSKFVGLAPIPYLEILFFVFLHVSICPFIKMSYQPVRWYAGTSAFSYLELLPLISDSPDELTIAYEASTAEEAADDARNGEDVSSVGGISRSKR